MVTMTEEKKRVLNYREVKAECEYWDEVRGRCESTLPPRAYSSFLIPKINKSNNHY